MYLSRLLIEGGPRVGTYVCNAQMLLWSLSRKIFDRNLEKFGENANLGKEIIKINDGLAP